MTEERHAPDVSPHAPDASALTPEAPVPTPQAAVARSRTPGGVWATLIVATVVGIGAIGVADLPTDIALGTAAERLLPPDGYAQQVSYADGTGWIVENSMGSSAALLTLPEAAGNAVLTSLQPTDSSEPVQARIWRQLWTSTSGAPQQTVMDAVTDTGIRRLSLTGTSLAFVYSPGLLVLPADAAPGASWASSGTVVTLGLSYSSHGTAVAAANGCLGTTLTTTFTNTTDTSKTSAYTESTTYCPGQGPVAGTSPLPDGSGFTAAPLALRADLALTPPTAPTFVDSDAWTTADVTFGIDDPAFGLSTLVGDLRDLAVTTPTGTTVFAGGSDLIAYTGSGATATRAWVAHPGGSITALGIVDDAVLVATTNRQLVAYSSDGLRQWAASLPDTARAAPVADGKGGILLRTVDGTLLDLAVMSGIVQWRTTMADPAMDAPTAADGVAYAADYEGAIHAYSVSDGHPLWTADTSGVTAMAAGPDAVYGLGSGGWVYAVDAATGAIRWSHLLPGTGRGIAVLGDTLIAQSDEQLLGLGLDGSQRWSVAAAGDGLVAGATSVLVLQADSATLVDAAGTTLGTWPLAAEAFGAARAWVVRPDGVWLIDEQAGNPVYQATFLGKAAS